MLEQSPVSASVVLCHRGTQFTNPSPLATSPKHHPIHSPAVQTSSLCQATTISPTPNSENKTQPTRDPKTQICPIQLTKLDHSTGGNEHIHYLSAGSLCIR